ncbi:DUF1385 domain-containing protein [Pseudoflavonifractor phocaeensis]|uniref:DUF1385 domain-containing protein n=1 Tax=Pseudoflavonifractor phocaeensis TaxID=1870988 RepID=UPI00313CDEBA
MLHRLLLAAAGGFKTMIGGQALIEGIMMMGPDKKSVVVRKPDGELEVKTEPRKVLKTRHPFVAWPFIRGVVNFCSSMYNGVTALMYSAEFFPEDDEETSEPSKFEQWLDRKLGNEKFSSLLITFSMVLGMAFSVFLFFLLPTALGGAVLHFIPGFPLWGRNLVEGLLRVVIFLGYLILCSHMKDIRRTFQYHGAEHKTIFCYEAGLPLTVENVRAQPKHHPRCGTSFLFVIIFVSIILSSLVFSFIRVENTFARMGLHLLMLPLVVAITYEINRYVGGHEGAVCRAVRAPGMGIQRWTTFEPDDTMIEVGIRALQEVLPEQEGADRW